MRRNFRVIGTASLLLMVAACSSKKKLAELPPAPVQAGQAGTEQPTGEAPSGLDSSNVANAFLPGSQEEFAA